MARPRKYDDYVVHRIADLFRYSDLLPFSRFSKGDVWEITLAEKRVLMTDAREIRWAIGELLCKLKREVRPRMLRHIADALEAKLARKRKSRKADDIAKIREAHRRAKVKQKGLHKGDDPTRREVEQEYGGHLDRRALKGAGCAVRSEAKSKKLPRPDVTRNRGNKRKRSLSQSLPRRNKQKRF